MAGVYDVFVNVVNRRTHAALRKIVSGLIQPGDRVLECACPWEENELTARWKRDIIQGTNE